MFVTKRKNMRVLQFLHCTHCANQFWKHSAYNVDAVLPRSHLYSNAFSIAFERLRVY